VALGEEVNAKKVRYDAESVETVLKGIDEIYAMKGKKVTHLKVKKDKTPKDEVLAAILGPFGTLRAPAFRHGRTLIVGFDEATYASILK
jgi:arsenate reductase-like glutaredoxin family protein